MEPSPGSTDECNSFLMELIRYGFPEDRSVKALTCSGYRGFNSALQWLVSHAQDPRLDDNDSREFTLYLCPTGELQNQIAKFYEASVEECGWTSVHNFIPHITLTPFFQVPNHAVPQLIQMLMDMKSKNSDFSQLLDNIPLELYASQNYMGLYITKSIIPVITSFLKELKLNMDLCSELKGHGFKESERKFHLSLAYHFTAEKYRKLYSLVNTLIKPNSQCKWELQLYSRDPYFAESEVNKVVHSYSPKRAIELELRMGDFIYVNDESQSVEGEWLKGTSWLTGVSGIINTNSIERTAISDTWISYLGSDESSLSTNVHSAVLPVKSLPNKNGLKDIYIMRHGERLDFTFRNWLPLSFDQKGNYVRKDLNMPKTLPERIGGPQGFAKDCPLTNIGELQALITGEAMKDNGVKIEHAFVSPSYRCIQTAHNVLLGLGLTSSIPICIEPGLFEWTAWYTDCFPSWLSPKELSDNGFFINTAYSPIIKYEHLSKMPENLEQYYNRSFEVMKYIIDKTELGDNDMSNNNSIPLKSELIKEIIKKSGSDFNMDRSIKSALKTDAKYTASKDKDANVYSEHCILGSALKREKISSLEEETSCKQKSNDSEYTPSAKKQFIPKRRKKGEEFGKKGKTTSYFKTRLKRKPMSGSEIEAILPQPDSQNDNGLLSRKQMSKESTFDSLASASTTVSPTIDKKHVSETLPPKEVTPSSLKFGFLGLGRMGSSIVRHLLNSGHTVYIWNRTPEKCAEFEEHEGAEILMSPCDVVSASDITFCCVSDGDAARQVVFGNCGVLFGINSNKAYVEMSGIDAVTSNDIAEAIVSLGGRYLEVRLQGSFKEAQEGSLIIVAAGDRLLYDECSTCFYVCSKQSLFLGEEVGSASNMNLVLRLMFGVSLAGLAEGMALADRCGLNSLDVIKILKLSPLNCSFLIDKCLSAAERNYGPDLTLKHLQKDINLALDLGDSYDQSLGVAANANELYKHTKRIGYKNFDSSAIFRAAKL